MLSDDTEVFMASPVQSPSANNNNTRQHKTLVAADLCHPLRAKKKTRTRNLNLLYLIAVLSRTGEDRPPISWKKPHSSEQVIRCSTSIITKRQ